MGFVKSAYIKEKFWRKNKMFKKLKDKKGFTLVELIVVLVVLAILAALLIPALTGYIDKANKEKTISEARMVLMAAQTATSDAYGTGKLTLTGDDAKTVTIAADANLGTEIENLAECKAAWNYKILIAKDDQNAVSITSMTFSDGTYKITYTKANANPWSEATAGATCDALADAQITRDAATK